jgi:hypothetical protein
LSRRRSRARAAVGAEMGVRVHRTPRASQRRAA